VILGVLTVFRRIGTRVFSTNPIRDAPTSRGIEMTQRHAEQKC